MTLKYALLESLLPHIITDFVLANCAPFFIQDDGQRQLQILPCHPVFSFHFMRPNFHPHTKQQDLLEFYVVFFTK